MNAPFLHLGPVSESPVFDLSDSLDIRLLVAGRLSPTAVHVRHERAELAKVLGPSTRRRAHGPAATQPEAVTR